MAHDAPTVSMLVIGNEILSGRTQDKNIMYVARRMSDIGGAADGGASRTRCA